MIEGICKWFKEQEERHIREAEEAERKRKEYAIEQARENKRKHEEALKNTVHVREVDLLKAAEWFRLQRSTEDFIDVWSIEHVTLSNEAKKWI